MTKYGVSEAKSSVGFKTYAVRDIAHTAKKSVKGLLLRGAVFVSAISMVVSAFAPGAVQVVKADHKPDHTPGGNGNPPSVECASLEHDGFVWNGNAWKIQVNDGDPGEITLEGDAEEDWISYTLTNGVFTWTNDSQEIVYGWLEKNGGPNDVDELHNGEWANGEGDSDDLDSKLSHITICFTDAGNDEEDPGKIIVVKQTNPDGDPTIFNFTASYDIDGFSLSDGEQNDSGDLDAGVYTVSETILDGWELTNSTCSDQSPVNAISLQAGETVTCTFFNTKDGAPEDPNLHFIKVVCEDVGSVEGNQDAHVMDDSNGAFVHFSNYTGDGNSHSFGPLVSKPITPSEIPTECERVDGWSFLLSDSVDGSYNQNGYTDVVGPTVGGVYSTTVSALDAELETAINSGSLWVSEVEQNGFDFAAIRCYKDALNGDNLEFVSLANENPLPKDIYCIAYNVGEIPAQEDAEVTICKEDPEDNKLPGWFVYLKGPKLETVVVNSNLIDGVDSVNSLTNGQQYLVEVSGTWTNRPGETVDAEYVTDDNWATNTQAPEGTTENDLLEVQINDTFQNWGDYNDSHTYSVFMTGTGSAASFRVFDGDTSDPVNGTNPGWYGDNVGSLNVDIYPIYGGTTGRTGDCVVIANVPFGTYILDEIMKDGWVNVSGKGQTVEVDQASETFTLVNDEEGDDTPPGGSNGGGGSSSSGSRDNDDDEPGRVLGESTGLPYQAPQVLGESTELPRTGTPIALAFSFIGILAIVMIPKLAKVKAE